MTDPHFRLKRGEEEGGKCVPHTPSFRFIPLIYFHRYKRATRKDPPRRGGESSPSYNPFEDLLGSFPFRYGEEVVVFWISFVSM